jgi:hypothetical protein
VVEAGIEQSEEGWLTPELLRRKGEFFLLQDSPAAADTAEQLFRQGLDEARRQETLSWELRAATSLARLLRDQGRAADAWLASGRSTTALRRASAPPICSRRNSF